MRLCGGRISNQAYIDIGSGISLANKCLLGPSEQLSQYSLLDDLMAVDGRGKTLDQILNGQRILCKGHEPSPFCIREAACLLQAVSVLAQGAAGDDIEVGIEESSESPLETINFGRLGAVDTDEFDTIARPVAINVAVVGDGGEGRGSFPLDNQFRQFLDLDILFVSEGAHVMDDLHRRLLLAHTTGLGLLDTGVHHVDTQFVLAVLALEPGSFHLREHFRYPDHDGPQQDEPSDLLRT